MGSDALIEGTLTFRGGCLRVTGFPAVWPEGTQWDSDREVLALPDGVEVRPGDSVRGGGGFLDSETRALNHYPSDVAAVLDPCVGPTGEVASCNRGQSIDKVASAPGE